MLDSFVSFLGNTGIAALITSMKDAIANADNILAVIGTPLMLIIACVLLYLAIVKKFEPLLLLPTHKTVHQNRVHQLPNE